MKKTVQGKEETHMTELLKLPVGIENFEEIRRDNFYYVDRAFPLFEDGYPAQSRLGTFQYKKLE